MSELALLQSIADRLAGIEAHLGLSSGGSASGPSLHLPRSIRAFDAYTAAQLDPFVAACNKLGGDAATVGGHVQGAWMEMRKFLLMASACKEPAQSALPPLLAGVAGKMKEVAGCVNRNEWEKHTKTCAEGVQCLNWLCVKPAPRDFIESYVGGSDYWANNIRKEYRATNPDQIAFCDTFKALIVELMAYVKDHHTTGVSWNAKGVDVSAYDGGSAAPAPAAAAAKPVAATKSAAPGADLFSALNKEGAITSGLKKVTKDQQTWRAEFKGDAAAAPVVKKAPVAPRPAANQVKGPAKLEFEKGPKKWCVENQTSEVTVTIGDIKENVYVYGCAGATINVVGKCKSVILDSCKKTRLNFDAVMASCEVVNCQRIHIECREKAPSVAVDKTDGVIVQLPATSLDTSVVASKSSEMNMQWLDATTGELVERPIPEQYVHRINLTSGSITADVSDLYGH
ncbi:unnamed protein product [Ectocarpus fasciculatus]